VPIAFVALVMAKLTGPVWALAGATALSLGVVAANALGDTIERTRDDEIALASRAVGATEVAILRRHVWPTFQLVLPFVPAAALTTVFVVDGVQAEVVTPGSGLGAWAVGGPAPGLVALASAGLLWAAGRVSATRLGRRRARLLDPLAFERRMR
jgi:ABC-type microcin C transport system permease subunit YejE